MERVAAVMEGWADSLDLDPGERACWRAAGLLHDALREADPAPLRPRVDPEHRELPGPLLHGPAAAARLRDEGIHDSSLLRAIAHHTTGHPEFDRLGRALFCADFLEPGRSDPDGNRARKRELFPEHPDRVTFEVLRLRIRMSLDRASPIAEPTLRFWNAIVAGTPNGR